AARRPPTPAAEGSRGARRPRAGEAFLCSFFLRLLGGSARAPAGGSRERPGRAGSGARGAGPGLPLGRGAQARAGAGCRAARVRGQGARVQGGGGGVPGAAAPEGAGRLGSPAVQGTRWSAGLGLARGRRGAQSRHAGGPPACAERKKLEKTGGFRVPARGRGGCPSARAPHRGAPSDPSPLGAWLETDFQKTGSVHPPSTSMATSSQYRQLLSDYGPPSLGYTQGSGNSQVPQSKYAELLAIIEELGKEIRPTYAGSKSAMERLKRGIIHARGLVRECLAETERNARS
uniref:Cyclin dependent kinase 2 associated protein 1 n=1 Tax=Equus caballus TaxID=9796 RepID=F6XPD6_HORSE